MKARTRAARTPDFGSTNGLGNRTSETALWGCELRASYPGYRSDSVSLDGRRSLDDPNVGTIILHRLANVQGRPSASPRLKRREPPKRISKRPCKRAQRQSRRTPKTFAGRDQRVSESTLLRGSLSASATGPKQALRRLQILYRGGRRGPKIREPLRSACSARRLEGKWEDAANYSKQAIDLNPVEFPSSFWYNTLANYNLNKPADASKSAQALLKLDTVHRYPEANRILAEIALSDKDFARAASYLRAYLTLVLNAKDADALKQQLLKIDEARAHVNK